MLDVADAAPLKVKKSRALVGSRIYSVQTTESPLMHPVWFLTRGFMFSLETLWDCLCRPSHSLYGVYHKQWTDRPRPTCMIVDEFPIIFTFPYQMQDIREDCRYLKHRVSNLESINARLFHMVQNQQRVHCDHHSCQEISKHPHIDQTELCFPDENDEPRPMFPSMPGSHIHLSPGNSRSVRLDQSVVPSNSNSPKNDNSHLQINRASSPQEFTSHYPASRSVNERPPNAVVPITRTCLPREQSTLSSTETMRTLEVSYVRNICLNLFSNRFPKVR